MSFFRAAVPLGLDVGGPLQLQFGPGQVRARARGWNLEVIHMSFTSCLDQASSSAAIYLTATVSPSFTNVACMEMCLSFCYRTV